MINTRQIPTALSVVSYIFLIWGILAIVGIIGNAIKGSLHLDFNILGFWIFVGLRRYSPGWRACALIFIWIVMIACAAAFTYGLFGHGPAFIKIFGKRYADIPVIWFSIFAAAFFYSNSGCIEFSHDQISGACFMMNHELRPGPALEPTPWTPSDSRETTGYCFSVGRGSYGR